MRMLDKAGIDYEAREYEYGEDLSGVNAARHLGLDPAMVFKTLVAVGDKTGPAVFVIPVQKELDLKKAAKCSNNKRVEMLHMKDLLATTGYIRGGCSPIGMKKKFPTFIDESAKEQERICISAGARGCQTIIASADLIEFVGAGVFPLTAETEPHGA